MTEQVKDTNMMPRSDGSECGNMCLDLWRKRQTRQISQDEMEVELAYMSLNYGFDELEYKTLNLITPKDLVVYYDMPFEKKQVSASFWKRPDIENYLKKQDQIYHENLSNYTWLQQIKSVFAKRGDAPSVSRVNKKLETYPSYFIDQNKKVLKTFRRGKND